MIDPKRTPFLIVIGAATLLAMVPVALVVWIQGDGADGGALDKLVAASPIVAGDLGGSAVAHAPLAAVREVEALPALEGTSPDADAWGPRLAEPGDFDGVPRAWLAPFVITGRVVDATGAPLAGAAIRYIPDEVTMKVLGVAVDRAPSVSPVHRTDAEGCFTLHTWRGVGATEVLGLDGNDSGELRFRVLVDDPRCASEVRSPIAFSPGTCNLGTITVEPGATLEGRVVDADGRPLPGVGVKFTANPTDAATPYDDDRKAYYDLPDDLTRAITDAEGRYAFRSVWPGKGNLQLTDAGWLQTMLQLPPWSAGERVRVPDLVASRGAALAGRVLDENGQPVEGARAGVISAGWDLRTPASLRACWDSLARPERPRGVTTDASGVFEITGLAPGGEFTLLAGAHEMAPQVLFNVRSDDPRAEFRLQREAATAGVRVELFVEDETGSLLGGSKVHIMARTPKTDVLRSTEAVAPGCFMVLAEAADTLSALIMAPGRATTLVKGDRLPPPPPGARATPDVAWHVTLVPESRIDGRVVTAAGRPVPGASVRLLPGGESKPRIGVAQSLCDDEGRFSIGGLRAGTWVPSVVAEHVITELLPALTLGTAQQLRDVQLTVGGAGGLRGRVRYQDGSVPEEFGDGFNILGSLTLTGLPDEGATEYTAYAMLGSSGRFEWPTLPPGNYSVSTAFDTETPAEVRFGETTELDIVVPHWALVRGIVLAAGVPVAGAVVEHEGLRAREMRAAGIISCGGPIPEDVTTDADGRFQLFTPFQGKFAFRATALGGGRSAEVVVLLAPGTESDITLQLESGRIEGRVLDTASGEGVPGATVWLIDGGSTTSGDDGRFVLDHVPAGESKLCVTAPGFLRAWSAPITLGTAAVATDVMLPLTRATSLRVTVLTSAGRQARKGTRIIVWPADGSRMHDGTPWRQADTAEGVALIEDLVAGSYWFGAPGDHPIADPVQGKPLTEQIRNRLAATVTTGEVREVTLQLADGAAR